uniref:Amidohydrolase-related domain-containing protein n=1 Tax=Psilocybe cubensis TaxID=181762 RepID=A0A8H8CQ82_PSICU
MMHLYYSRASKVGFLLLILLYCIIGGLNEQQVRPVSTSYATTEAIARCLQLSLRPAHPENFHNRTDSDRFDTDTPPVLIQNARMWTGRNNGTEVIKGEILVDKGIIQSIGHLPRSLLENYGKKLLILDAKGAWVTPGLIDVHSHIGVDSIPEFEGTTDTNSFRGIIQPWLRSIDGLNTHDNAYPLSIAGGVTTSLILPGSANAIGGQAFVIKHRETSEKSPSSMILEPPFQMDSSNSNTNLPPRWRHINMATRIKERQDKYCTRVFSNDVENLGEFPDALEWEALVDVLRGRVKVHTHCYEAVDVDSFIRISNEFKFPIAVFHHTSEAYLVPNLIKNGYGHAPAIALFATFARYKREAYRSSVFAPRILAQQGLTVLMKSDHPAMNSRYLMYEAQQAYFYGLPQNLALLSVTSNAAEVLGMGHRIGYLDKDLVIWDSHPLALGATPVQVLIDGVLQLQTPHITHKPSAFQKSPKVPNFDDEARRVVEYEGLPPLSPSRIFHDTTVVFKNVNSVYYVKDRSIGKLQTSASHLGSMTVVTRNGIIVCHGSDIECMGLDLKDTIMEVVDLEGGSLSPALVSFGYPLGLVNIRMEPSTNDGSLFDPLLGIIPKVLGGDTTVIRAFDGLQFGTRNALLAYRSGVSIGVTAPLGEGFLVGLATAFSLGALHKLEDGAIIQEVTSVHVSIGHSFPQSVSTQIAVLRKLLLGDIEGDAKSWFGKVSSGKIPLVVEADSADVIATLLVLKKEVEVETGNTVTLTIYGGAEAHLLAKELANQNVGVILNRSRPFPRNWDQRRIIPGPPISKNNTIVELLANNITVGIGCDNFFGAAQNLPFDLAWAAIESGGLLTEQEALAIGSTNVLNLLGVEYDQTTFDLVATRGGNHLGMNRKVVAMIMVKNTKKPAVNHGKSITSFFARTPKTASQEAASSSSGTTSSSSSLSKQVKTSAINSDVTMGSGVVPLSSTKSPAPEASAFSPSSLQQAEIRSPSENSFVSPLKRLREPDRKPEIKILATRQRSESLKSDDPRHRKFDSDSDGETNNITVFVTATHITQNRKKVRLSPPEKESLAVIPSSQSEEELVLKETAIPAAKAILDNHKQSYFHISDPEKQIGVPMDIDNSTKDAPLPADNDFPNEEPTVQRQLPSVEQMLVPPISDLPSLPSTPQILDPDAKTALIIAEIKAKAYAETAPSPEPVSITFKEELDNTSSEDDDLVSSLLRKTMKQKPNPNEVSIQPTRRSTRHTVRNKSDSSPSKRPLQKTKDQQKATPKKLESNPIKEMLKERRAAEKRGGGSDLFRKADLIAKGINSDSQEYGDMDVEDARIDWDTAAETARNMTWFTEGVSPQHPDLIGSEQISEDDEQSAIAGKVKRKGQIIVDILEAGKVMQQEKEYSHFREGISIWESSHSTVDTEEDHILVEELLRYYQSMEEGTGINLLKLCLQQHDILQASMLLEMDILTSVPESDRPRLSSFLCGIALRSGVLAESAAHSLERFWGTTCNKSDSTIQFAQGWDAPVSRPLSIVNITQRDNVIRRLLLLVGACARSKRIKVTEIPNMSLALLLLGMDLEASPDLIEDITRTVNLVCNCLREEDQDIVNVLCEKILHCIESYTPINKARVISMLSAGSDITHHIASVVSYNVIISNNNDPVLSTRPPLSDIIDELVEYSGKNGKPAGKFAINNKTNYDDVGFYTFILGVAVSDIRGYVADDLESKSKAASLSPLESPVKFGERQGSDLQMLIDSLENLHNKISDTRAAHLERSRAKTNIKGLSMTIFYQQRFWQRNGAGKGKTLSEYFKKK